MPSTYTEIDNVWEIFVLLILFFKLSYQILKKIKTEVRTTLLYSLYIITGICHID